MFGNDQTSHDKLVISSLLRVNTYIERRQLKRDPYPPLLPPPSPVPKRRPRSNKSYFLKLTKHGEMPAFFTEYYHRCNLPHPTQCPNPPPLPPSPASLFDTDYRLLNHCGTTFLVICARLSPTLLPAPTPKSPSNETRKITQKKESRKQKSLIESAAGCSMKSSRTTSASPNYRRISAVISFGSSNCNPGHGQTNKNCRL